jgi:hypothetical protein
MRFATSRRHFERPTARAPFGPNVDADLFERRANLDHLDVDQLHFRLIALRPGAEQHYEAPSWSRPRAGA